jgi:hypothetical protein
MTGDLDGMPTTLLLNRVIAVPEPEFVVNIHGRRLRGYVTSVELWNAMTRFHLVLPATSLDQLHILGRIVDNDGVIYQFQTGGGSGDGLMSEQTVAVDPVSDKASSITLQICDTRNDPGTPSAADDGFTYFDVASVVL